MEQTAVEWFADKIKHGGLVTMKKFNEALEQAKEMEKSQQFWNYMRGWDDNLKKVTDIHNALGFMRLFLDLKGYVSEQEPLMVLYKNENGENVFVINTWKRNIRIYVNYGLIYRPLGLFLETNTYPKKMEFLQQWFKDKYDIIDDEFDISHFSKDDYVWGVN